jgi:hypothetical protein
MDKHSSLLQTFVNYACKKFHNFNFRSSALFANWTMNLASKSLSSSSKLGWNLQVCSGENKLECLSLVTPFGLVLTEQVNIRSDTQENNK